MVDIIRPTRSTFLPGSATNKVKESSDVQTYNDDTVGQNYIVMHDRRKNRDRRGSKNAFRPLYESRSGKGRRKGDSGQPNIEIKI